MGCQGEKIKKILFAAALAIPLQPDQGWQTLKFGSLPANSIEFKESRLFVDVDKSASPLIYPLKKSMRVKQVQAKGQFKGSLNLKKTEVQGDKGADDYVFRLGFVVKGKKTLNFAQRMMAPKWIKTLFRLASEGVGVDHIYFLNIASHRGHLGRRREHPMSDLIKEEVVSLRQGESFEFTKSFDQPLEVLALWISIDGDDTGSRYQTIIDKIELRED